MGAIKLDWACSRRGADMGRAPWLPLDRQEVVKLRLFRLRIYSGGYDQGAAYWGFCSHGERIFWAESLTVHRLEAWGYEEVFGRVRVPMWAPDREEAKRKIAKILPHVKFFR